MHAHNPKNMNSMPTSYHRLLGMAALSFIAMYILMYTMVNSLGNVFPNFNQFYMAGLMTMPMIIFELFIMKEMYPKKEWNTIIIIISILAMILFFMFIREQTAISDEQFLKSMIPHHAAAILMCEKAPIQDPKIKKLCQNIIANQQAEIDQMKEILNQK